MLVEKNTASETVSALQNLKTELIKGERIELAEGMVDSSIRVFQNHVLTQGIRIECSSDELFSLVDGYLYTLSGRQHPVAFISIGLGCPIETWRKIKSLKKSYFEFSLTMPSASNEDRILFEISFLKPVDAELFDIELFSKRFCS